MLTERVRSQAQQRNSGRAVAINQRFASKPVLLPTNQRN